MIRAGNHLGASVKNAIHVDQVSVFHVFITFGLFN